VSVLVSVNWFVIGHSSSVICRRSFIGREPGAGLSLVICCRRSLVGHELGAC